MTPNLNSALLGCQPLIHQLVRDSHNANGRYHYVSADSAKTACRPPLLGAGLLATRRGNDLVEVLGVLVSVVTFELVHVPSGEKQRYTYKIPVAPNDRQPDGDKAVLATLTTAWTYFLEGLLCAPRGDGVEIDSRTPESGSPETRGGAPDAMRVAPAGPSSPPPKQAGFDPANKEHQQLAEEHFIAHGVREGGRAHFLYNVLPGLALVTVGETIRAAEAEFKKRSPFPIKASGSRSSWQGGRR